jgi:uridine kinase
LDPLIYKFSLLLLKFKKYPKSMLIIGIAGGSGCGKSTVVKQIIKKLPKDSVTVIPQDSYYKDNGHLSPEERARINFDHPSSIEFNLLVKHLDMLKAGETIGMPIYSYLTCARAKETIPVQPREVVIVEGILIMSNPRVRDRMDIKVFVDAEPDDRLMRIIRRDIEERGRSFGQVLDHYEKFVKPMHLQFIEPSKRYADIIVPQGGANHVAIDILTSRIKMNVQTP